MHRVCRRAQVTGAVHDRPGRREGGRSRLHERWRLPADACLDRCRREHRHPRPRDGAGGQTPLPLCRSFVARGSREGRSSVEGPVLRRKVAWPTVALRGLVAAAEEERNLGWLAFFFAQICSEPHSTKGIDDLTGWARKTTPENLVSGVVNPALFPEMPEEEALEGVRCPVLLMHGTDDRIADSRPAAGGPRCGRPGPSWSSRGPVTAADLLGQAACADRPCRRTASGARPPHAREPPRLDHRLCAARPGDASLPRRRRPQHPLVNAVAADSLAHRGGDRVWSQSFEAPADLAERM